MNNAFSSSLDSRAWLKLVLPVMLLALGGYFFGVKILLTLVAFFAASVANATALGGGLTSIGDDCLLMTGSHVAHDVKISNKVILANCAAVAGHCIIEDEVIIGGLSGIHQFVRIGRGAIIGAVTMVTNDVIPFGLVQGPRGALDGLNLIGLKRRGVDRNDITALRAAFQSLAQGDGAFQDRARKLGEETTSEYVDAIVNFILGASDRSFLTPGEF